MPFAGGNGSQSDPYQIETWEHLDSVRNNLSDYFVLNNNLDSNTAGYDTYASSNANGGSGWNPIGAKGNEFTGNFNGNGLNISDLYIDRPTEITVGLFGYIGVFGNTGGTIQNLNILDVDIDGGGNALEEGTGALSGVVTGSSTIDKVLSTGLVKQSQGVQQVGGLMGTLTEDKNENQILKNSYSDADIIATSSARVGGLVGFVNPASFQLITVENSYATGNVDGDDFVGGLAGRNDGDVKNCFATGNVTSNNRVGGIIGSNEFGNLSDSYWDKGTTNQGSAVGVSGTENNVVGFGNTSNSQPANKMIGQTAVTNMSAFDFSNNWDTVTSQQLNSTADGYPILIALNEKNQLEGQGIFIPPQGLFVWTGSTWKKVAGV